MRVKSDSFLLYCLHSLDECIYYYYIIIMIVVGSVASSSNEAKSINPHSHCNPLAGWNLLLYSSRGGTTFYYFCLLWWGVVGSSIEPMLVVAMKWLKWSSQQVSCRIEFCWWRLCSAGWCNLWATVIGLTSQRIHGPRPTTSRDPFVASGFYAVHTYIHSTCAKKRRSWGRRTATGHLMFVVVLYSITRTMLNLLQL